MVRNQNADFHLLALSEMIETESSQYLCYSEIVCVETQIFRSRFPWASLSKSLLILGEK